MSANYAITSSVDTPPHILLVEDDSTIADLVCLHLQPSYEITRAEEGEKGFELAKSSSWSMILLDLRLPKKDGLEICRDLRAHNIDTPILMLTSRAGELDRVLGLEMGADDYLVKPFSFLELEARIKALLRRANNLSGATANNEPEQLCIADLCLCEKTHQVTKAGQALELTAKEFDLLAFFMRHPDEVFSRNDLLSEIWGYGHSGYEHTVNSHINRLRGKIEPNPTEPNLIVTVWGVGYKLVQQ